MVFSSRRRWIERIERRIFAYLEIDFGMWIEGVIDRVKRDVEVRQPVEDPSELRYRVLFGKLLTARHFGEPLSAENPVEESLLLVKTCYGTCNSQQVTGLRTAPGFFLSRYCDIICQKRGTRFHSPVHIYISNNIFII